MPELPREREQSEQEFARRFAQIGDRYRPLLIEAMGTPPDHRNIPESLWQEIEDKQRDEFYWAMLWAFFTSYNALHLTFGQPALSAGLPTLPEEDDRPGRGQLRLPPADRAEQEAARKWADETSTWLSRGMLRTNKRRLELTRRRLELPSGEPSTTEPDSPPDRNPPAEPSPLDKARDPRRMYAESIADLYGPERGERIAITETTRSITAGEYVLVSRVEAELGWVIEKIWQTERDEDVCVVCGPLHGKPESYYRPRVGAAPAHVECRCWHTYRSLQIPIQVAA